MLDHLPDELIIKIYLILPVKDLVQFCRVGSKYLSLCNEQLWESIATRDYPQFLPLSIGKNTWGELIAYLIFRKIIPLINNDETTAYVIISPNDTLIQFSKIIIYISEILSRITALGTSKSGIPIIKSDEIDKIIEDCKSIGRPVITLLSTATIQTSLVHILHHTLDGLSHFSFVSMDRIYPHGIKREYPPPNCYVEIIIDPRQLNTISLREIFANPRFIYRPDIGYTISPIDLEYTFYSALELLFLRDE